MPSVDHLDADSVSVSLIPIVGARDDVVDIVNLKCLTKQKSASLFSKIGSGIVCGVASYELIKPMPMPVKVNVASRGKRK